MVGVEHRTYHDPYYEPRQLVRLNTANLFIQKQQIFNEYKQATS